MSNFDCDNADNNSSDYKNGGNRFNDTSRDLDNFKSNDVNSYIKNNGLYSHIQNNDINSNIKNNGLYNNIQNDDDHNRNIDIMKNIHDNDSNYHDND